VGEKKFYNIDTLEAPPHASFGTNPERPKNVMRYLSMSLKFE
jgi:hypothetical protein